MLKCYGPFHLARVLPQALVLAVAEIAAALVAGDRARAGAVFGAWRWNLARLGELRALRRDVRSHRVLPDAEVRRLQLRGSARAMTYLSRLTHEGFDVAHGRSPSAVEGALRVSGDGVGTTFEPVLTGSLGQAFSEDADFDDLDDLGRRANRDRFGRRRPRRVLATPRSRLVTWVVVALVLTFGTRDLFAGGLPLVGQFLPLGTWSGVWHHLVAGWQPAGVGSTAPATPAFAVLGVAGTALFGAMGLVQKVLVLGCIPLGGYGVARLLRPLASPRARLVAAICYLGLPLPYDDLARGRWDGLVAYAAVPFVLSRLARASGFPPFDTEIGAAAVGVAGDARRPGIGPRGARGGCGVLCPGDGGGRAPLRTGHRGRLARGRAVARGVAGACRCCWRHCRGRRAVWAMGGRDPGRGQCSGGLRSGHLPVCRSDLGRPAPLRGGPGRQLAAGLALGPRRPLAPLDRPALAAAWAARLWAVAVLSWTLAWLVGRSWTGSFAPSLVVLLAPAAVAVAVGIGLGVSAFESDLSGYRFGWRQIVTGAAVLAAVLGVLPAAAESFDGRWGLVSVGYSDPLAFMASSAAQGPFRVLWLGDPQALPTGGWSVEPGLAYATSEDGTPDVSGLWTPAGPGPADGLAQAVSLAIDGRTTRLGRLLAPAGIRYVVVVDRLAPAIDGVQSPAVFPLSPRVPAALLAQNDLREVPGAKASPCSPTPTSCRSVPPARAGESCPRGRPAPPI